MLDFIQDPGNRLPILAFIGVVLVLTGCADKRPPAYQGYVEGEFVHVAASEPGRLERLQVARGETVKAGAPLFVLESDVEAAAKRQAQQQLSAAEAQLEDLKAGKRPLELDVIRAQFEQAMAVERKSAAKRTRDEAQYPAGGISKAQLDDTRAEAESSSARVRELKSLLEVAGLPAREEQIRAQAALVAAARAGLEQVEWRLNQKTATAAQGGIVSETLYRKGEWIPAGSPVVRLLPPENVKVRFFVPEPVVGTLTIGQAVWVHGDGLTADVPAKVTYVAIQPEYTPPIIYSNETRSKLIYMVEANPLADKAAGLHPGQPVEVRLQ